MATQRITVTVLAGEAGAFVQGQFRSWHTTPPHPEIADQFCDSVLAHAAAPPVTYFCQWIDHWLTGDAVSAPNTLDGRKYQVTCLTRDQALAWAEECSQTRPVQEQHWLAVQLRQASTCWPVEQRGVVLIIREVIGPSLSDQEIESTLNDMPNWLREWAQT